MTKAELEERLIQFAVLIIKITNELPSNRASNQLGGQLLRSGTSPALNYGEARSAESLNDFIHKLQLVLKELRESYVCLKIIHSSNLYRDEKGIVEAKSECNELISIFVKSVQTATKRKIGSS
ncbi:four helix bundle protein [Gracilimonas sp.]|uniref:four helix bundle protein n=1 Tax=Gracilimonas sp. TaxID=1974203 RepID=UPI003BA8DBC7